MWRASPAALLALCCLYSAQAVQFKGFDAGGSRKPEVRLDDDNVLVELLWTWDEDDLPTMIKFVPGSEQVLVAHKLGTLRLYDSIDSGVNAYTLLVDMTAELLVDMTAEVNSIHDHGLTSFEFHPDWDAGVRKVFLLYSGEPKDIRKLPNYAAILADRPPDYGTGPPGDHGQTWGDECPCLDCDGTGANLDGLVCEKPYYLDRFSIDLDAGTATRDVTLLTASCGSSTTHGPTDLKVIGKDLIYGAGDSSQVATLDYGLDVDACFDPNQSAGQGSYRCVRETFGAGKIGRIPHDLLDSDKELAFEQVELVAKGLRQPWRMFHHKAQDRLYIGDVRNGDPEGTKSERIFTLSSACHDHTVSSCDVGNGDPEDTTSERIFHVDGIARAPQAGAALPNFGWPCIEGVRTETLGPLGAWTSATEQEQSMPSAAVDPVASSRRIQRSGHLTVASERWLGLLYQNGFLDWLDENGLDHCDATVAAAQAFIDGEPAPADGDPGWQAPIFEYRTGIEDPDDPETCFSTFAAITSVYFHDPAAAGAAGALPSKLAGRLIFSDYAKACVWYFENGADGLPDTTVLPKILMVDTGLINITQGPDGAMYGLDYVNGRLLRMSVIEAEAGALPAVKQGPVRP
ncbi:hypothetical protein JKP88DRAFT_314080 [Tribonema minus]|uniref:Glucose/Sorbosone dehydrogenase domain-containing protein n=1 Tax=Tribonema minus TaxID=303371 RepID=A0A835YZK9_9STRA|nr:hypothetical protein JKP88DRAFT_314080 [Tribonema minus]